ncbi:MAG: TPM domain-containing protein [Isosphaeraceae bacterium]|nr:TPM domain-containing protein [Isosphaeraceae bacterium]
MLKRSWLLCLPLVFAASLAPTQAATIRDNAGMFDPSAVQQANRELDRVETKYGLPVTIETVGSLDGQNISQVLQEHARAFGAEGLYVLISKGDHRIEAEVSGAFKRAFPTSRTRRIWEPIGAEFKKGDFNAGLLAGARAIETQSAAAKAEFGSLRQGAGGQRRAGPAVVPPGVRPRQNGGTFGIGTLLGIGLVIVAVLIGFRLLGALFGGGGGYAGPGRMGGPGYGAPGYGGGGGGFMSSLFGGLGGALAGNWLYDQFSGRHHGGYTENTSYGDADPGAAAPDNNDWSGSGGSWDDSGGGGEAGGGGDWGGGGGGDWGGGGGGDWGGGGGDGGGGGW